MRINHNIPSMVALAAGRRTSEVAAKAITRLSTGLRINAAADDAAGLGISENLRSQVRGSQQALRNAQDAITLLQIGDGAMNEVAALLQRGRELTVQAANDTLTTTERSYIQMEIAGILKEVDRIGAVTNFNGIPVLKSSVDSASSTAITNGLKETWMNDAINLIQAKYGLSANNVEMDVILDSSMGGGEAAYVSSSGPGAKMELHINASSPAFVPPYDETTNPDGGSAWLYSDRTLTHELTHAVMAQDIPGGLGSLPTWFTGGTAELIHGADDRLKLDIGTNTPTVGQAQGFLNSNSIGGPWNSTSSYYSAAYTALRYMNANGSVPGVLQDLQAGTSFDQAIANNTSFANVSDFLTQFQGGAGAAYMANNNSQAAESQIRDADFAQETAELTRSQILMQSSTAMLAQANTLPQAMLQLIRF